MEMKILTVDRNIYLKPAELTDAEIIFNAINANREYLRPWLPFVDFTKEPADTENFIKSSFTPEGERSDEVFLIFCDDAFAGLIGLKFNKQDRPNKKTEIGYWIIEKFQGRGLITKSCRRLIERAFNELGLNRAQLKIAVGNKRSLNVAERLNFVFEGIERDGELLAGGFIDLKVFSVLKKEFNPA
jgi:ribosomal-protein-serine acetyltransferase